MKLFEKIKQWVKELDLAISLIDKKAEIISIDTFIDHEPTSTFIQVREPNYLSLLIALPLTLYDNPMLAKHLLRLNQKSYIGSFCLFKDTVIVFKYSIFLRHLDLTKEKLKHYLYLLRVELERLYPLLEKLYQRALDPLDALDLEKIKN